MIGRLSNRPPAAKSFLMKTKVFGIGFHKTATTSLAKALSYLGYRVTGPNWVDNPNPAERCTKWHSSSQTSSMPFKTMLGLFFTRNWIGNFQVASLY